MGYLFNAILIISAMAFCYFLIMMGPVAGGTIGFGIILASVIRGLLYLRDIQKRLAQITKDPEIQNTNEVLGFLDYINHKVEGKGKMKMDKGK